MEKAASRGDWPMSMTAIIGKCIRRHDARWSVLNQWRMAELHPRKRLIACASLRRGARVFDRTKDGRILQRNFGGHNIRGLRTSATARGWK